MQLEIVKLLSRCGWIFNQVRLILIFFSLSFKDWFAVNLSKNDEWRRLFAVTWWQWHWRNKTLFEDGFEVVDKPSYVIRKYVWELENLNLAGNLLRKSYVIKEIK